jgi:phosphoadenosine phosphosulfate reductase
MLDKENQLIQKIENKGIKEQLEILAKEFKGEIVFSTSLGQEDQVITDIIFKNNIDIKVFSLDTGRLFEETYKVLQKTTEKYNKEINVYFPEYEQVQELVTKKGPYSFYESVENRKECCNIRKVVPLNKALKGNKLWITGLRADQSEARTELPLIAWDENFKLFKFNPLKDWNLNKVVEYLKENSVPYNILHDKGFVSIGCAPCTRAIKPGEHIRTGRWWWEDNTKKECGLHEHNEANNNNQASLSHFVKKI